MLRPTVKDPKLSVYFELCCVLFFYLVFVYQWILGLFSWMNIASTSTLDVQSMSPNGVKKMLGTFGTIRLDSTYMVVVAMS